MAESKRRRFQETVIEQVDDKASDKSPESPCPSPPLLLSAPQDMDGIEHEATSPVSKDDKASSGWDRKTPPRKQSDRRSASRSPKRRRSRSRERRRRSSPDRRKRRSRSRDRKRRSHSRERRRSHSKERRRSRHSRSPSSPPRRYCSKWAKPSTGLTRAVLSNKPQKKSKEVSIEEVEQRVARHMEAVKEKNVKEAKRINLPGYLNPAMVNVQQFKQVRDKRKLLWSKAQDKKEVWTGAFDDANSEQEKFKRLMGIHGELNAENAQGASGSRVQESKKVLENLEREYEKSRAFQLSRGASGITGMGLGFGSLQPP